MRPSRLATSVLVAITAGAAAMAGAVAGLFGGWGVGALVGLPGHQIGGIDHGFDQLDLGLLVMLFGWAGASVAGGALVGRRRGVTPAPLAGIGLPVLGTLALGATVVGSATADWYFPLAFFGGPSLVLGGIAFGAAHEGPPVARGPAADHDRTLAMLRRYDDVVVPVFAGPFTAPLVATLAAPVCPVIIDLATGSGATARALHDTTPDALIVGIDLLPPAAVVAAERSLPSIRWVVGDAAYLPLRDRTVGAIACQQGAQFFTDPPAVMSEAARALAPGGRMAILSWAAGGNPPLHHIDEAALEAGLATQAPCGPAQAFQQAAWIDAARSVGLVVDAPTVVEAEAEIADVDAFVAHFIDGADAASRRTRDLAAARIRDAADRVLRADLIVLERPAG